MATSPCIECSHRILYNLLIEISNSQYIILWQMATGFRMLQDTPRQTITKSFYLHYSIDSTELLEHLQSTAD